jgi:hypothetical protein
MKVSCAIEEIELDGDHGSVPSVEATCSRCGHRTESYGTDARAFGVVWLLCGKSVPKRKATSMSKRDPARRVRPDVKGNEHVE